MRFLLEVFGYRIGFEAEPITDDDPDDEDQEDEPRGSCTTYPVGFTTPETPYDVDFLGAGMGSTPDESRTRTVGGPGFDSRLAPPLTPRATCSVPCSTCCVSPRVAAGPPTPPAPSAPC